ncbi:MAG: hypothetical protein A2289_25205 [Deltaproteobacteria bacterium RIFOXYA12_FULL_58_15]|nr:MAG: hypothetical protein A2289_25205 [Deltaproteobacteria bacterium RIFOXYA12_FULL_58_15]OGR13295.1 MAG: hypothetical protein A2341_16175 [Deltaproteobacteria bacterium RIFOXYB12_FULL_58_9]
MWSLIKMMVGVVFFAAFVYGTFFIDIGQQTLAGHILDIWRAPVVQEKFTQARDGVKRQLEDRLAEVGERAGHRTTQDIKGSSDDLTDADRESLHEILRAAK